MVKVVVGAIAFVFTVAFAGSAVPTTRINAIRVSPICFTISSKCLYYL